MLHIILWLLLFFFFTITSFAQVSPSTKAATGSEADRLEVLRLEETGRQKTLRGDTNWDDLVSDRAYMIGPDGNVILYEMGKGFPPFPVKSFILSEMIARPFGEVVVVTGLAEVEADVPGRGPVSFKMRFLNVWKRFGKSWKMVVTERTSVREQAKPN